MTGLLEGSAQQTLAQLLDRQANSRGSEPFLACGETQRTFSEARDAAAKLAGALRAAGVVAGDRVGSLAENRIEMIDLWLACTWLGAVFVPLNAASRGAQLQHVLTLSEPRLLVVEAALVGNLDAIDQPPPELERLWRLDGTGATFWRGLPFERFPIARPEPVELHLGEADEAAAILFTSGTTGPAKGVVCPHSQFFWWGVNTAAVLGIDEHDSLYTSLPLFHTNALNTVIQALVTGARVTVGPRFSASRFWQRLVDSEATVTYILGAMATIIASRDPSPLEREHTVRVALAPATPVAVAEIFRERFGIELVEGHGMTETNFTIGPLNGEQRPGTMGRVLHGFEAIVADGDEVALPDGAPGELLLRSRIAGAFSPGYWRMPEATAAANRGGWFHTGDRVVRDPDGYVRFLDRIKDVIRRRGENISAWEVEEALLSHPSVVAAAAVPVPSSLGEDEVMVFVVLRDDETPNPSALLDHCEGRLAYFAVPRYVEFVDSLPLTENGKVRRFALRERGLSETTWDREVAGYQVRRSAQPAKTSKEKQDSPESVRRG